MSLGFTLFIVVCFLAVVLLFEGIFLLWTDTRSPEVNRVKQRLHLLAKDEHTELSASLSKQRVLSHDPGLQSLLLRWPGWGKLDRLLMQSGYLKTLAHLLAICLGTGLFGVATGWLLHWPLLGFLFMGLATGALPLLLLMRQRAKRLDTIAQQLPDALDLISRSLRAGHGFSSAMAMVSKEAQEPIAGEFKITLDEINFGISTQSALANFAARVPIDDLRFFVVAVVIQLQSGGNLAELLGMLSYLIRERFKLFGKIRVLAAEGKMSAYILTALPFFVAGATEVLNPSYLNILFTDPLGIRMVMGALGLMLFGVFVMWRIINIRV
jgi:tight adherence protein B